MASIKDVKALRKIYERKINLEFERAKKKIEDEIDKIYNECYEKRKEAVIRYLRKYGDTAVNKIVSVDTLSTWDRKKEIAVYFRIENLYEVLHKIWKEADQKAKSIKQQRKEHLLSQYEKALRKLEEWEIENLERVINKEGLTKFKFKF